MKWASLVLTLAVTSALAVTLVQPAVSPAPPIPPPGPGACQQAAWGMFDRTPGPGAKHPRKLKKAYASCLNNRKMSKKARQCLIAAGVTAGGVAVGGIIGGAAARAIAGGIAGGSGAACIGKVL